MIRSLELSTGNVTTLLRGGISLPRGVALTNETLYVVESGGVIRALSLTSGLVTTLTTLPSLASDNVSTTNSSTTNNDTATNATNTTNATAAMAAMAVSASGRLLFVAVPEAHRVFAFDVALGTWETLAGSGVQHSEDGIGTAAQLSTPVGLALLEEDEEGGAGQFLFVSEWTGHRIRRIDLSTREVTTIAGDGTFSVDASNRNGVGVLAQLHCPMGLALHAGDKTANADNDNNIVQQQTGPVLLVADGQPRTIRTIHLASGSVGTYVDIDSATTADDDHRGASAQTPTGLVLQGDDLFIMDGDSEHPRILRVWVNFDTHTRAPQTSESGTFRVDWSLLMHYVLNYGLPIAGGLLVVCIIIFFIHRRTRIKEREALSARAAEEEEKRLAALGNQAKAVDTRSSAGVVWMHTGN